MKDATPSRRTPTAEEWHVLFESELFIGLSHAEQERAKHLTAPTVRTFATGEAVVHAGKAFAAIGLVTEGRLSVTRGGERRPVIHRTLSHGDTFGVSSLFGGEAFPTTITADEPTTVIFLTETDVRALIALSPLVAERYITLLTEKIRFLNHRLDTLAGRSAEERVAAHLLSHTEGSLGITKSALASLLGLGRASLYRILDQFEAQGLIKAHRDRIEVPDAAALQMFIKNRKEP